MVRGWDRRVLLTDQLSDAPSIILVLKLNETQGLAYARQVLSY